MNNFDNEIDLSKIDLCYKNIIMQDVYHKINFNLVDNNFESLNLEAQKNLVTQELKNYMISKALELNPSIKLSSEMDLYFIIDVLGRMIPKEKHFFTLRHLTHYIMQISSTMQDWSIVWYVEIDVKYIENPLISFNDEGKWDTIITHEQTDYIKTFKLVYDVFQNNFLNKGFIKQNNKAD